MTKRGIVLAVVAAMMTVATAGIAIVHAQTEDRLARATSRGIRTTQGVISGTITDADTGQPVKDAYVVSGGSTISDADGRYVLVRDLWHDMIEAARRRDGSLGEDYATWPLDKLAAMASGDYAPAVQVRVSARGYDPMQVDVSARRGSVVTRDFALKKSSAASRSDADTWSAASRSTKVPLKRPAWIPPGFTPAPIYDGGDRATPFSRPNPRVADDGSVIVQYDNGDSSLIVHCGTAGDIGEATPVAVDVNGNAASLVGDAGDLLLTWTETKAGRQVRYAVQGRGDRSVVTSATVIAVARSMRDL